MPVVFVRSRRSGMDPLGMRSPWSRRRRYIEGNHIQAVPGSAAQPYDPMAGQEELLHVELAALDVNDHTAVEEFASRWGLLGSDQSRQPIEEFRQSAQAFRHAFETAVTGSDGVVSKDSAAGLQGVIKDQLVGVQPVPGFNMDAADGLNGWALLWSLPTLLAGAYLLLFLDLKEGRRPRLCANERCRRPFVTDRADKHYCQPRCSDAQKQREIRRRAMARGISMAAAQRQES